MKVVIDIPSTIYTRAKKHKGSDERLNDNDLLTLETALERGVLFEKPKNKISELETLFYGMSDTMQIAVLDIMKVTQQKGESNE